MTITKRLSNLIELRIVDTNNTLAKPEYIPVSITLLEDTVDYIISLEKQLSSCKETRTYYET